MDCEAEEKVIMNDCIITNKCFFLSPLYNRIVELNMLEIMVTYYTPLEFDDDAMTLLTN